MTTIEKRVLAALASIFALRMFGLFMIIPVFAIYAAQLKYASPTWVGFAMGAYGLTQAALQIPFGFLSDRIGRKPIIFFGLLLFALGNLIAAQADTIYLVALGRLLQGASAIGGVIMALASDFTRPSFRARVMGLMGLSIGLSFAAAMIIGPMLSAWIGISGLFYLTAFFSLIAMFVLFICVPTQPVADPSLLNDPKRHSFFSDTVALLCNPALRALTLGVFVLHASLVALFLRVPLVVQALGFSGVQTGMFYGPVFVGALFSTVPWLMIGERLKSPVPVLGWAILVLLLSECALGLVLESAWELGLVLWLFFTGFNVVEASLPALVSRVAPLALKGTALGIYSTAQFIGIFVGGSLGGKLNAAYGTPGILSFCIVLTSVWLYSFYRQLIRGNEDGTWFK